MSRVNVHSSGSRHPFMVLGGVLVTLWSLCVPSVCTFLQVMNGLMQTTGWPAVVACVGNWFGKGKWVAHGAGVDYSCDWSSNVCHTGQTRVWFMSAMWPKNKLYTQNTHTHTLWIYVHTVCVWWRWLGHFYFEYLNLRKLFECLIVYLVCISLSAWLRRHDTGMLISSWGRLIQHTLIHKSAAVLKPL